MWCVHISMRNLNCGRHRVLRIYHGNQPANKFKMVTYELNEPFVARFQNCCYLTLGYVHTYSAYL